VSEDEVRKASLGGDGVKLLLVLHVALQSDAHSENKTSNSRDEAGEERVEGESSDEAAVHKLHHSGEQDVEQVRIDDLELVGGGLLVVGVEVGEHRDQAGRAGGDTFLAHTLLCHIGSATTQTSEAQTQNFRVLLPISMFMFCCLR